MQRARAGVDQPALRDAAPVHRVDGQDVALDHRHPVIEVGQHAGRQEAAHAGAEYHRVTAAPVHKALLTSVKMTGRSLACGGGGLIA